MYLSSRYTIFLAQGKSIFGYIADREQHRGPHDRCPQRFSLQRSCFRKYEACMKGADKPLLRKYATVRRVQSDGKYWTSTCWSGKGTAEPEIRLTSTFSSYSSQSSSIVEASLGMIADLSPSISSCIAGQ